jgi:hypothetical protein
LLAWFGGNLTFGILAEGSWLPGLLYALLPDWAFDLALTGFLWLCRLAIFAALVFAYVESARRL